MNIYKEAVYTVCLPGDILLTSNPAGLGSLINFGQNLEDGTKDSVYGHVGILAKKVGDNFKVDGTVFESVTTISKNPIMKYTGQKIKIIRHQGMNKGRFFLGREEILDNLGQIYPGHRIILHGFDMVNAWIKRKIFRRKAPLKFRYMKLMPMDWPVCSELGAQFIHTAGLEGGWEKEKDGWRGVNPDDFNNASEDRKDLWLTVMEGVLSV